MQPTMATARAMFVCILIAVIDIMAGVLGIEAENAQNKGKHLRVFFFECKEPVHQAYRLGLAAAALLALAHIIANLLGGCICVSSTQVLSTSSPNRQFAIGTLVLSWIVLAVAFTMLMVGAMSNSKSRVSCGLVHHRFLSIGGILCFVHVVVCAAYYTSATATRWEEEGKVRRDAGASV